MKTAVIYSRVSTLKQVEDGHSLEAQEQELLQYAKNNSINVLEIFKEEGKSGKNNERDELQKMLNFVKRNKVEKLLVYKLSRLSRKVSGLLQIIEELSSYGTYVEFVNDRIDTATPMGRMITTMLGAVAEMERENILEYSKMGQLNNAKEGRFNGGAVTGYKTIDGKLIIDEHYRAAIIDIFRMYAEERREIKEIATTLNGQGFRTIRGKVFTHSNLGWILKNEVYIGNTIWVDKKLNKTYKVEGTHEPLVSKELWDKAQQLINDRKIGGSVSKGTFLLTGLLKCPNCGANLIGTKHARATYAYYRCWKFIKEGKEVCSNNSVRKDTIEADVLDRIAAVIENKDILKIVISKINAANNVKVEPIQKKVKEIEKKLKNIEKEKHELYEEKLAGKISFSQLGDFLTHLEKQENELKKEKQEADALLNRINSPISETEIIKKFNKAKDIKLLSPEKQKRIIKSLIQSIEIKSGTDLKERTIKNIKFLLDSDNVIEQESLTKATNT